MSYLRMLACELSFLFTQLPMRSPSPRLTSSLGRFGRGMVRPAVSGIDRRWAAKSAFRSPRYTTRLDELVAVRA